MKKTHKKAFSLVELSIVILIASILIGGSLTISNTVTTSSKTDITKERMDIVYEAITNFVAANKRLPCPAALNVAKGNSAYGNEGATPGTCTGAFKSSTNAPNLAWGMVPIKALGLDPDMAEDGFGTKFSYVVDMRFTLASVSTSSTNGFEITKSLRAESDASTVDLSGIRAVIRTPTTTEVDLLPNMNGILMIISHGANKSKGFNASSSTAINSYYDAADEAANGCDENSGCSTSGTTSFWRRRYVSTTQANFDDITLFKNKTQLVKDAGLEFIMCNQSEATTSASNTPCPSRSWNVNANYGEKVFSTTYACYRICGKYGIWGSATKADDISTVYFYATKNGNQAISQAVDTTITNFSEVWDTFGAFNNTTGVFTAPVSGLYLFNYGVLWMNLSSTSGRYLTALRVNSADIGRSVLINPANRSSDNYHKTSNNSIIYRLSVGDTISVRTFSSISGTSVYGANTDWTFFSGILIKPD